MYTLRLVGLEVYTIKSACSLKRRLNNSKVMPNFPAEGAKGVDCVFNIENKIIIQKNLLRAVYASNLK